MEAKPPAQPKQYRFFLGGADLEMEAIRALLQQHDCDVVDEALSWGKARIIAFKESIIPDAVNVFIEPTIDEEGQALLDELGADHYLIIDHHGQYDHRESSLEQIADLLGVTLTAEQQLIAINDKAYIPGLLAKGISRRKINEIRRQDRKAQGVTDNDELAAKQSIADNREDIDDITYVQSLTKKDAPIVDRLFFAGRKRHLIIYHSDSVCYYGPYKSQLQEQFGELIDRGDAYSGGGANGFFGIDKKLLGSEKKAEKWVTTISDRLAPAYYLDQPVARHSDSVYSYHNFAFPFKLPDFPIDPVKQEAYVQALCKALTDSNRWTEQTYLVDSPATYNEKNYFYPFIWKSMFPDTDALATHLSYQLPDKPSYKIKTGDRKPYKLKVESIQLSIYPTGIGILSFNLLNTSYKQSSSQDILKINQFGRRIYPPFINTGQNLRTIYGEKEKKHFKRGLQGYRNKKVTEESQRHKGTMDLELPRWISVLDHKETFKNYMSTAIPDRLFQLPVFIKELFRVQETEQEDTAFEPHLLRLEPVLDDRMFVTCWYGNNALATHLAGRDQEGSEHYKHFDWWYEYTFVDNPNSKSCQNQEMAASLIAQATNGRWMNYGNLYGATRYSFVLLTREMEDLKKYGAFYLPSHLRTLYHRMVMLCLLQRASILMFSDQINTYSKKGIEADPIEQISENYSRFINQFFFREVTALDQGIELYNLLQDQLMIQRDVKDLEAEIQHYRDVLLLKEGKRRADAADQLNLILAFITALFIVPGFLTAYYGMNTFDEDLTAYDPLGMLAIIGVIVVSAFLAFRFLRASLVKGKTKQAFSRSYGVGLVIFLMIGLAIPLIKKRSNTVYEGAFTSPEQPNDIRISLPERLIIQDGDTLVVPPSELLIPGVQLFPDSLIIKEKTTQ